MIKTLIFDFGDVFINLDKPATENALLNLGIQKITKDQMDKVLQYEKGLIDTQAIIHFFTKEFSHIPVASFIEAWNSILLDFPEHRLEFIKELAKKNEYELLLLSNTNDLHITWIQKHWGAERYEVFKSCFDQFYLSHEIHMSKPNTDIFEFVLQKNNLKAEECLFIDDTKENTDAAVALGIHIWNINPKVEDITNLFIVKKELF